MRTVLQTSAWASVRAYHSLQQPFIWAFFFFLSLVFFWASISWRLMSGSLSNVAAAVQRRLLNIDLASNLETEGNYPFICLASLNQNLLQLHACDYYWLLYPDFTFSLSQTARIPLTFLKMCKKLKFSYANFSKYFLTKIVPFETTQEILIFVSFGLIHQRSFGLEFAICSDVLESKMCLFFVINTQHSPSGRAAANVSPAAAV